MKPRTPALLAFLWGLAEATLFFVVPDVFLSWLALERRRTALLACAAATVGALLGGMVMYLWATHQPARTEAAVEALPAVSPAMMERVRRELSTDGWSAMVTGAFRGTPYKVYAVEAGRLHLGSLGFLLATPLARLPRFLLLTWLASWVGTRTPQTWSLGRKRRVHVAVCTVFYLLYWSLMPW